MVSGYPRPLPVGSRHGALPRTAHTRFDVKFDFVWITKYRKRFLRGDVGVRLGTATPFL